MSYRTTYGNKVLEKTPIHSILGPGDKASIRLTSAYDSRSPADLGSSDFSALALTPSSPGTRLLPAQILVAVAVNGNVHNVNDWLEWLTSHLPREVTGLGLVRLEGVYGGNSTLITVAMPIAVWNLLRHSRAYRCIGYITTPNMLSEGLQVRARENLPKSSEPCSAAENPKRQTWSGEMEKGGGKSRSWK